MAELLSWLKLDKICEYLIYFRYNFYVMTASFDSDWYRATVENSIDYKTEPQFEENFRKVGENLKSSELLWSFVKSFNLNSYKLNTKFEEAFVDTLVNEIDVDKDEFDSVWDVIKDTVIDDVYCDNKQYEDCFDKYSYELLFNALSKPNVDFINSEIFEKHI